MTLSSQTPFFVQKDNVYIVPVLHYNMETAAQVQLAFNAIKPDCIAVELPENMELQLLHAVSRLPDISIVSSFTEGKDPLYYLCEPCDGAFEGLRLALENHVRAFCIDLDVDGYPNFFDHLPDPFAIQKIGLKNYYEIFQEAGKNGFVIKKGPLDYIRELYMAKRLKELSFSYDRILCVVGMSHLESVLKNFENPTYPEMQHAKRDIIQLYTPSEHSVRNILAECGWISRSYEVLRNEFQLCLQRGEQSFQLFPPDRQQLIYNLYKKASEKYIESTGNTFPSYNMRNIMKFMRNYALISEKLMPDLFQILTCARSCVDNNFAYHTWELATEYPYHRNVDNLPDLELSVEELWGHSKKIKFQLKQPGRKDLTFKKRSDKANFKFNPFALGICSYPPEDLSIEKFGDFLKKKGTQILTEEAARSIPFTSSVEEGIDTRESIRHWFEKKLYVKVKGKPPGGASSVVVIFDEDHSEDALQQDKFPWKLSWLGENAQESDMAFYATPLNANIIGPGISRCEYGGFMLSSPPRRMANVWSDPDYDFCRTKAELLLVAAIDYAVKPIVIYVAAKPPRSFIKTFATRYGKKIVFIPIGQLSLVLLNKIRVFHVLDGYGRRGIADEYIF